MKKIFTLILLACLSIGWGFSQSIQLIMSPRPSCYFSDWQNKTETIRMIVNNTSKAAIDCKIKTQLFNSKEEMIGETDFNKMPVLTLQPGISQFNAEDIYPLDAIKLFGNSLSSMLKTGRIPEDNYRLCTDLVDPVKGTPLTPAPQCKMFTIVDYQAPVLLSPREDDSIPEARIRGVIFRWTPVTPSANQLVIYRLQIWEVLDGQTKVDACRNNMPVYEKDLRAVLQTGWPVDFVPSEDQEDYVWSITAKDGQDRNLVTEGYGMAEPFGFTIGDAETPAKRLSGKGDGDVDLGPLWETLKTPALSSLNLVQVKLSQPSPNQLKLEELNIQLTNNAEEPVEVSLRGTVTIPSLAEMRTKADVKPFGFILAIRFIVKPFTLPPGTKTITYDDVKTGNVKFSSDEWAKAFGPGGVLPPGDYEICVSVLDKSGKEIGKGCIVQKITGSDIPNDIAPADGQVFSKTDIKKPITFRWIPVIPKPKDPVTYRLRVWQLMQGQTGEKAIEVNQPLITKDVDNLTQTSIENLITGPCLPPYMCEFVWNVQAFNKDGKQTGETMPSPRGWFGFRIEGHVGTTLTTNDACKDFGVVLMDDSKIWRGDSAFVATSITNKYRGDDPKNKPRSFRIKIQNGLDVEFADNVIKGWTRTPSKFPPGSSSIKWTNNSGDIPNGETKFGRIGFANAKTGPISVQYEWLNKDDQVICSGTIDLPGNSGSGSTGGGPGTIKLISPVGHGGTGDEGSGEDGALVTFKWSAPDIKGPFSIGIVELKESQSPDEAMLKNKAFFEQNNIEGTSFKYPGSAPKFVAGQKYAWWIWAKESRSSISIFDRWGRKVAYSWGTDYHLDNTDILRYLQTDEVIIKKGKYLFDYSSNPNGDVILPLAKPIPDNRINKADVMFEGVPADIDCAKDGSSCVGGPKSVPKGKPFFYTVKPVIANGYIIELVLSYKAANSGQNGNNGDAAVTVKLNPPASNLLKLTDLTNFTLTNGILKPLEVLLSCTLTSAKTQPLLIIVIIVLKKFTLPPGPTTFTPDDFKSGDIKFASDEWSKAFGPNGKVPAGDYTLCVSVSGNSGEEIGKGCIEQKIIGGDAPQLISPKDDLPPTSSRPTFEWKMEPALENVSYSITVKELEEGKDIENGKIVLEQSGIRENTLPFPKDAPSLDAAKSYAWQVSWFKNGKLVGRTPFTRFRFSIETRFYYDLAKEPSNTYTEISNGVLRVQFYNPYASVENIQLTVYDVGAQKIKRKSKDVIKLNSITGLNRISIDIKDYNLEPGRFYLLTISDFNSTYHFNFKVTNDREK